MENSEPDFLSEFMYIENALAFVKLEFLNPRPKCLDILYIY